MSAIKYSLVLFLLVSVGFLTSCKSTLQVPEMEMLKAPSVAEKPEFSANLPVDVTSQPESPLIKPKLIYDASQVIQPESRVSSYVRELPDFRTYTLALPDFDSVQTGGGSLVANSSKKSKKDENEKKIADLSFSDLMGGMSGLLNNLPKLIGKFIQEKYGQQALQKRLLSDRFLIKLLNSAPKMKGLDRLYSEDLGAESIRLPQNSQGLPGADYKLYLSIVEYNTGVERFTVPARFERGEFKKYREQYEQYLQTLREYIKNTRQTLVDYKKRLESTIKKMEKDKDEFIGKVKKELDRYNAEYRRIQTNFLNKVSEERSKPLVAVRPEVQSEIDYKIRRLSEDYTKNKETLEKNIGEVESAYKIQRLSILSTVLRNAAKLAFNIEWAEFSLEVQQLFRKSSVFPLIYQKGKILSHLNSILEKYPALKKERDPSYLLQYYLDSFLPPEKIEEWKLTSAQVHPKSRGNVAITARLLESKTGLIICVFHIYRKDEDVEKAFDYTAGELVKLVGRNSQ